MGPSDHVDSSSRLAHDYFPIRSINVRGHVRTRNRKCKLGYADPRRPRTYFPGSPLEPPGFSSGSLWPPSASLGPPVPAPGPPRPPSSSGSGSQHKPACLKRQLESPRKQLLAKMHREEVQGPPPCRGALPRIGIDHRPGLLLLP